MIVALTSAQMLGIAAVAAVFVVFALVSSFALPSRNADFPGRRLPLFIAVTVVLFAAMLAAIVTLAREDEEEAHGAEPAATETNATETNAGGTETEVGAGGDTAAGKEIFASAGCGGCHVLEEAGSTGVVGPSLDGTDLSREEIATQVRDGGGGMPPFSGQLSEEQINDVAAFVVESSG